VQTSPKFLGLREEDEIVIADGSKDFLDPNNEILPMKLRLDSEINQDFSSGTPVI
jgi:hypothetical protein